MKLLLAFQHSAYMFKCREVCLSHFGVFAFNVVTFGVVSRLYKQLTLIVDEPEKVYPTVNIIWSRFVSAFLRTLDLLLYAPVFKSYFYEALQQFYDDGVQYIELRSVFPPVFVIFYVSY